MMQAKGLLPLALALLALGGCASVAPRDERGDISDALRRDMRDCGTDTECLRKGRASRSSSQPAAAKPAGEPAAEPSR